MEQMAADSMRAFLLDKVLINIDFPPCLLPLATSKNYESV
jgi:hypothetical protein